MGATLLFTKLLQTAAVTLVTVGATWLGEKIFKVIDKEINKQQAKDEMLNNEDRTESWIPEKEQAPTIPNVTDAPPVYEEHFVQGDSASDIPSVPAPPIGGAVPGTGTTTEPTTGAVPGIGTTTQTGGQLNWIGGVAPTKPNVLQPDGLPLDIPGVSTGGAVVGTGSESTTKEPEPNPEKPKDEETNNNNNNPGIIAPSVKDETETNIQNPVQPFMTSEEWMKFIQDEQAKRWAREDDIRRETQEREDNAYQRAIADMRKAGINPNLFGNINPAESGGGITQASGMNFDGLMNQMKIDSEQLMQLIEQNWQGDENDKTRIFNLISSLFSLGIMSSAIKKR